MKIFKKLDAFLRNESLNDEDEYILFDPDIIFNENKDPWYTDVYWAVYGFFKWNKVFHPIQMYKEVKWFLQRGRRGWADCDTWSLDSYLDRWMPDALHYLKAHKQGIPCGMIHSEDGVNEDGSHTEAAYALGEARWDAIMDKMIAAFEANARISEGLYEKELGEYPLKCPEGVTKEDWKKRREDRMAAVHLLAEHDLKTFEEGMKEFVLWYRNLWD